MRHPTIFFVSFDVIATSPRNVHTVLILAVAKIIVLSVFLLVEIVMGWIVKIVEMKQTWTTSVTKKKIEIYLMYLMIEKPKTPKNKFQHLRWIFFIIK